MSFINDIIEFGLGAFGIREKGSNASAIVSSALTSLVTNRVNNSVKKINPDQPRDPYTVGVVLPTEKQIETIERDVKLEIRADANASIPVVYGDAWVTPLLVDARLTDDYCTMWYCVALSEVTGTVYSTGVASEITFEEIWWDNKKLTFDTDGVSVLGAWDGVGAAATLDSTLTGQVKIYCYNGGSTAPASVRPQGLGVSHGNAYDIMPGWTAAHQMNNLVFALIRVDYASEKEIDGLGSIQFKLRNSISSPGDVLYDYLTNTIYGAGLSTGEIA